MDYKYDFTISADEFADILLRTLLEKLPATRSRKGFFVDSHRRDFVAHKMAEEFTYNFYGVYVRYKINPFSQEKFLVAAQIIFEQRLFSEFQSHTYGFTIACGEVTRVVSSLLYGLKTYGMLGNRIENESERDKVMKVLMTAEQ